MSYLDKKDQDFIGDYQDILDGKHPGKKKKETNMTLPF